jgi:sulfur carrier protein
MTIQVNGEPLDVAGPLTISALLSKLEIDGRLVAVEHNLTIIKRAAYDTVMINEGDEVEIVRFVGGGERRSTTSTARRR